MKLSPGPISQRTKDRLKLQINRSCLLGVKSQYKPLCDTENVSCDEFLAPVLVKAIDDVTSDVTRKP